MEYTYAQHKRAVEIEAALEHLVAIGAAGPSMETWKRGQKALLPIYEPLAVFRPNGVAERHRKEIVANTMEALAVRLEAGNADRENTATIYMVHNLRVWSKLERNSR